jgi:hypothetical protein
MLMSSPSDQALGNTGGDNAGTESLKAQVAGATLNTDKSTENSGETTKDGGKAYIGSLPDRSGMGAAGIRDITTPEEEDARAAQLGGDPDVADSA